MSDILVDRVNFGLLGFVALVFVSMEFIRVMETGEITFAHILSLIYLPLGVWAILNALLGSSYGN